MKLKRKRLHQALRRSQLTDPSPSSFVLFGSMISLLTFIFCFRVWQNFYTIISPLPDVLPQSVYAANIDTPQPPRDNRVVRLEAFLSSKKSPLARYAQLIVTKADEYDIGWTKLASVSRIESQFGTTNPDGSHNAWGIMNNGKFRYFDSWEAGIEFTSRLLGKGYKLAEYGAIKTRYCPSSDGCNPEWAHIANEASEQILAYDN